MRKSYVIKWALIICCVIVGSIPLILSLKDSCLKKAVRAKDRFKIGQLIKYFPFSKESSLREWEEKMLRGRVVYIIEQDQAESFVRAKSTKTASALYYKVKLDVSKQPVISWKWRVDKFPERSIPARIE